MSDEESAFQAALDANPDDHVTRGVFGDWLCDRGDERGEGYQALSVLRRVPQKAKSEPSWNYTYSTHPQWLDKYRSRCLPRDWWALAFDVGRAFFQTRAEAEDGAAIAFAKLPLARRLELLAAAPA